MTTWDEDPKAAAIITALDAALPASVTVCDLDDLPTPRPEKYVAVSVSRRYVPERRFGGRVMLPGGRLVVGYGARTVSDIREMRRRATAALENVALTVGGDTLGPFVFETADDIDSVSDGAWFASSDYFTF